MPLYVEQRHPVHDSVRSCPVQAGTAVAAARLDAVLVTAYTRLAEGFAAEPAHPDRDPRRAAEVRDNPIGAPCTAKDYMTDYLV